mgnify:CR=1 FL=1
MGFMLRFLQVVFTITVIGYSNLLEAQTRSTASANRSISLSAGVLRYALEVDGRSTGLIAVSTDYANSDRTRIEFGATYSKPRVTSSAGESSVTFSHVATLTAGVQARLSLGILRPYLGLSGGLFVRRDGDPEGVRYWKSTISVPIGIRVQIIGPVGVRGEYRIRRDQHDFFPYESSEITAGIYWTF